MDGFLKWVGAEWFNLLQTFGIVASLAFTAYTVRVATRAQRVSNLFSITQFHRDLWGRLFDRPELRRILRSAVDLESQPITDDERLFVSLLILHLNCSVEAIRHDIVIPSEQIRLDIAQFFCLPIPREVWAISKKYQNKAFVEFVEASLNPP